VLRLRARALETPEPQAMEAIWNGVSLGRSPMVPPGPSNRFDVPPEAMRRGTNVLELASTARPSITVCAASGPREVRRPRFPS